MSVTRRDGYANSLAVSAGARGGVRLAPRAVWGLTVAYRRRSLNQLNGQAMLGWQWRVATTLTIGGRGLLLGLLVAAGAVLRWLDVGTAMSPAAQSAMCWVLALLALVTTISSATPVAALALRDVPDRHVLMSLSPLTSGQYVVVSAVVPKVIEVVTLVVASAAIALPLWGPTSTAALAIATVTGGAVVGGAIALAATAAMALVPARAGRVRLLVIAAVAGVVLGVVSALVAPGFAGRWRGSSAGEVGQVLRRTVFDRALSAEPKVWQQLVDRGAAALLGASVVAALLVAPLAVALLRRVARRYALAATGPASRRLATGVTDSRTWAFVSRRGELRPTPLRVVGLLVVKDHLALLRLPDAAAAPLRRIRILGSFATGGAVGFALAGGPTYVQAITWMAAGFAVAVIGTVAGVQDEAIPVAGIEAERRAWGLLRSTPVPTGSILVAKAASVAIQVAGMVGAPLMAWILVLSRSAGEGLGLILLLVLLFAASGAGATLGSVLARRTEGSAQSTIERDPVAMIIHSVALVVAVLPVVIAYTVDPGGGLLPSVTSSVMIVLIVGTGAVVARSDTVSRRWR